jgi:TPP-dependent pyruvate/acetoin dehydrogenase alpha subunit
MNKQQLIDFETDIKNEFVQAKILAPIHLSDGNEDQLIQIFEDISSEDWVFSTWRNHYHALLHGIDPIWLKEQIMMGRSMSINCSNPKFFTSAIVGSTLSIATGAALALKKKRTSEMVWCFVGDMGRETGIYQESLKFVENHELPLMFIIEDNGYSVGAPTQATWGSQDFFQNTSPSRLSKHEIKYSYIKTKYPHVGAGEWVTF